jgi:hypothetical protein
VIEIDTEYSIILNGRVMPRLIPIVSISFVVLLSSVLLGCERADRHLERSSDESVSPQDAFWANLQSLCPGAAAGDVLRIPEGDTQIDPDASLVVHFWECGESEIRFPLHVDENRSRTWVFVRHADSLELRHDHRYEDGSEEANTWYGASTQDEGTATQQEFVSDRNGVLAGWRVMIEPGERYTYGTIRNGDWRHHLEFDLSRAAEVPPMHWGHQTRTSQRPNP